MLREQLQLMRAAATVLEESRGRMQEFRDRLGSELSVGERESCEALTARFARLSDLLLQRVFRTIDQIELVDEGSALDRLQRMEKRGVIPSAERWRELRTLRNAIVHDYLIESADRVLTDALAGAPELLETAKRLEAYARTKGYIGAPSV
jgi:uncharacterized protein YutE (UPF0331/DUF86 family)